METKIGVAGSWIEALGSQMAEVERWSIVWGKRLLPALPRHS